MFYSNADQHDWSPVPKPSVIDDLIAQRRIGEMTSEEYRVLTRQARIKLADRTAARSKSVTSRRQ
jgi:hypothetical protein